MANLNVTVVDGNNLNVQVTPTPDQTITIDRGVAGPAGPPGPNAIGGYPISITGAANYDALMFYNGNWVNVPQVEITDGGNF
jgi:hypothetical protein